MLSDTFPNRHPLSIAHYTGELLTRKLICFHKELRQLLPLSIQTFSHKILAYIENQLVNPFEYSSVYVGFIKAPEEQ